MSWSTEELVQCWRRIPEKGMFLCLLLLWLVVFQFFGHCQYNYARTPSLFEWMWGAWSSEALDSEQGKMIPFAVLAILWIKRERILKSMGSPWWPALIILGGSAFLHLCGYLIQQPRASIIAFFLGLYSLFGVLWGRAAMRASLFPMLLFAFCMPMGTFIQNLTLSLRIFATQITYLILHYVNGIDVVRQGTMLFDPSGAYNYDVEAACSGIRSMFTLLAITTIFGLLLFKTWWRRGIIIFLAIPLAIACNVIRLTAIVIAAKAINAHAGEMVHNYFGYVTYALAIGTTMVVAHFLREPPTPETAVEANSEAHPEANPKATPEVDPKKT
jgi:exosortase